jgi:hypothetical protein
MATAMHAATSMSRLANWAAPKKKGWVTRTSVVQRAVRSPTQRRVTRYRASAPSTAPSKGAKRAAAGPTPKSAIEPAVSQ